MYRKLAFSFVAFLGLILAGCSTRYVEGDHVTYRFNVFIVLGVGLLSAVALPAGWFLRRFSQRLGFVLMGVGFIVLVLVAPSMWTDRVQVDNDHFECNVGALGGSPHSIQFNDLKSIRWVEIETEGRGRHMTYFLDCVRSSGSTERVPVGDLMKEALEEILTRVHDRGIPIEGLPQ